MGGYQATPEYKITKANYDTYGKYLPILSDIEGVKDIGETLKEGKVSDATIFAAGLLLPAVGGKIFKGPLHHIFTNKNFILGQQWSKKFGPLFEKAGYALDDAINKVHVLGHAGRHPAEYHEAVYKRLLDATEGLEGEEYKKAFEGTLDQLSKEVSTPGLV